MGERVLAISVPIPLSASCLDIIKQRRREGVVKMSSRKSQELPHGGGLGPKEDEKKECKLPERTVCYPKGLVG